VATKYQANWGLKDQGMQVVLVKPRGVYDTQGEADTALTDAETAADTLALEFSGFVREIEV